MMTAMGHEEALEPLRYFLLNRQQLPNGEHKANPIAQGRFRTCAGTIFTAVLTWELAMDWDWNLSPRPTIAMQSSGRWQEPFVLRREVFPMCTH
jgi:hypothetical protein